MSKLPREFQYEYRVIGRLPGWWDHMWIIHGPRGSLHFHHTTVPVERELPPTAGLEIHYRYPPEYMRDQAPSHQDCQILGAPCWHDGTSLYAVEALLPLVDLTHPLDFFGLLHQEMKRFDGAVYEPGTEE